MESKVHKIDKTKKGTFNSAILVQLTSLENMF